MLTRADADELADLAEIVSTLARDIERHHTGDPGITELTTGEPAPHHAVEPTFVVRGSTAALG